MTIFTPTHKYITIVTSIYKPLHFEKFLENTLNQSIFSECQLELYEVGVDEPSYKGPLPDNANYRINNSRISVYRAWNEIIASSKTEFLCNYNIDDRSKSNHIEVLANALDLDDNASLAYCPNLETSVANETMEDNSSEGRGFPCYAFDSETYWKNNSCHARPLWRKSLHNKYGYFDTLYSTCSDFDFWLRCIQRGEKFIKACNDPLYLYFRNPKGVSSSKSGVEKGILEILDIRKKYGYIK